MKSIVSRVFLFLTLTLFASLGRAQSITVTLSKPGANQIVHDSFQIQVQVSSTFELQSVQATIENRTEPLVTISGNTWTNTMSTTGLSYGNKTLTITAVDVFGNSNQVQRTIIYDLPPTISVNSPSYGFVVRTNLPVDVVGADDSPTNPTVQMKNFAAETVMAEAVGNLNTNMVLVSPQVLDLFFLAKDTAGQVIQTHRLVYVETGSNLVEVAHVSDGEIKDVQPDRILFLSFDNHSGLIGEFDSSTHFKLMSKSRLDGTETVIYDEGHELGIGAPYSSRRSLRS